MATAQKTRKTASRKTSKTAKKSTPKTRKTAKTSKKSAKKTEAPRGRAPKEGLRTAQERILKALAKAKNGLTRADIAEKAEVDSAGCTEWLGSHNAEVRKANDVRKGWKSLLTLKHVKFEMGTAADGSETTRGGKFFITASGRKAIK